MISVHFYKADSLLGRLVSFFGRTSYVHCAMQIDGKHIIETDAFKRAQIVHLHKRPDEIVWDTINEKLVLSTFNYYINAEYDYGAISEFLKIGKQNSRKLTCVELCMVLLQKQPKNITPDEFYKSLI